MSFQGYCFNLFLEALSLQETRSCRPRVYVIGPNCGLQLTRMCGYSVLLVDIILGQELVTFIGTYKGYI